MTAVGILASASRWIASSRRPGLLARGSIFRARTGSSVVTDNATLTRPFSAMGARRSRSRKTSADLVTMADRMIGKRQNFKHLAHHPFLAFDRLIGVGIGSNRDRLHRIAWRRQFALEQACRIGLGKQPRLEIEPRRKAEIGMGRPRETIDAAMLAATIGIDRSVKGNIRRHHCG